MHSAPLWLRNATLPGSAIFFEKVAFKPSSGIITPRQFGPSKRIFPREETIASSSFLPSGPHSLKPAEIMTAPLTPASAHSLTTSGTVTAGVAIIARSTAVRDRLNARESLDPEHAASFWVYRVDNAAERSKVLHQGTTNAVRRSLLHRSRRLLSDSASPSGSVCGQSTWNRQSRLSACGLAHFRKKRVAILLCRRFSAIVENQPCFGV